MSSKNWIVPLLMGAFANTQMRIVGSIGISEFIMCIVAPFIFMHNFTLLKKDGFGTWIFLTIFLNIGCVASAVYNHTQYDLFLRGFATTYSLSACTVCFHHVLRKDIGLFRFVLLGLAISSIINIFAFHQGAEGAEAEKLGGATVANLTSGTLFWLSRLIKWLMLPINGWYLQTPLWYSIITPVGIAAYSIIGTASGRSAALGVLSGIFFVIVAGKSSLRMQRISKNIGMTFISVIISGFFLKFVYTELGRNGLLNDKQMVRYEEQTEGGTKTDTLSLLMHGRVEFFCGLYAAIQRPIWGYGPWPVDEENLYLEFLGKYGGVEDYEKAAEIVAYRTMTGRKAWLPSHSQIIQFWQWFGLPGLLIMLYSLYLKLEFLRKYLHLIPQLYGIMVVGLISEMWHFFFSPFGNRVQAAMMWALILLVRAIAKGTVCFPEYMWREKQKYDFK